MFKHELFWMQFALLALVGGAHVIAVFNYLYWRIPLFDIPMHFFGGMWACAFTLWFFFYSPIFSTVRTERRFFLFALFGTLLIGVGWEIMEYIIKVPIDGNSYVIDTGKDLIMDLLGALVAWKFILKRYA